MKFISYLTKGKAVGATTCKTFTYEEQIHGRNLLWQSNVGSTKKKKILNHEDENEKIDNNDNNSDRKEDNEI